MATAQATPDQTAAWGMRAAEVAESPTSVSVWPADVAAAGIPVVAVVSAVVVGFLAADQLWGSCDWSVKRSFVDSAVARSTGVIGLAIHLHAKILAALATVAAVVIAVVAAFRIIAVQQVRVVVAVHRLRNAATTGATVALAKTAFANTANEYNTWQAEIQ